jgi:hypothetical protein
MVVNVRRTKKPSKERVSLLCPMNEVGLSCRYFSRDSVLMETSVLSHIQDDEEPPLKKLAILETREEDQYDHHVSVKCYACGGIEVAQTPEVRSQDQIKKTAMLT